MLTPFDQIRIRTIEQRDNEALAKLIRNTLEEFGANHPGTVYYDQSTDHLFQIFQTPRSIYYVAEYKNEIVGGGGIYPTEGLPADTCELVKMYIHKHVRGIGLGKMLIEKCIAYAKEAGYKNIYLDLPAPQLSNRTTLQFTNSMLKSARRNCWFYGDFS